MRKSRFEDVGTFGSVIPDFSAESVDLLDRKAEIALRQRYDFELKCAIELKRREEAEKSSVNANLLKERAKACASAYPLRNFIYESFPIIEKGREFKNNWHIDAISEVLQAATIGEVKNAIVNIPRRTMKSLLVCVMWQSWVWTFLPQTRWVFISYSAEFAKRDNEKTKELLLSKYYQDRWGSTVRLTTERRGKLENTAGGFRVVFRVGQGLGEGGDFMIADDPNAVNEVESEAILEKTNRGWDEVGFHNVTDRATAIRFIMQQRTAPNDLTGHIVDDAELSKLYNHLCLAMKFDPEHPYGNSISKPFKIGTVSVFDKVKDPEISDLEIGEEKLWIDPRSTDAPFFQNKWYQKWYKRNFTDKGLESKGKGQLLWETYLTADLVAQDIAHLKTHGEHSQFQQLPTRRGGNFFNSDLFLENGKAIDPESIDYDNMSYCRFWDKAGCLVAGTLVETGRGLIPIEQIKKGDTVLTRKGYKEVEWAGITKYTDKLFKAEFNNNTELIGTGNHPVWTENRGWIELQDLRSCDNLISSKNYKGGILCQEENQEKKRLRLKSLTELFIGDSKGKDILKQCGGINKNKNFTQTHYTGQYGGFTTEKSLKDTIFITKTKTLTIMTLQILSVSQEANTIVSILINGKHLNIWHRLKASNLKGFKRHWKNIKENPLKNMFALNCLVGRNLQANATIPQMLNSVQLNVEKEPHEGKGKQVPVYDLTVADEHEFFANGVLVHNSENAGDWTVGMLVGVTNPTGSHLKAPRKCYIFDIVRVQRGFYSRMDLMVKTAEQDVIDYVDRRVNTSYCVAIEVEPASGGKDVSTIEKDALLGYDVRSRKARGTKAWRAETPRRTSEAGRLKLIRGDWNSGFISRLERFNPALSNNKDDEIDTLSGALKELLFTTTHKSRSSSGY